jgi:hypothetical protein
VRVVWSPAQRVFLIFPKEIQLLRKPGHPLVVHQHGKIEVDFTVYGDFEFFAGGEASGGRGC